VKTGRADALEIRTPREIYMAANFRAMRLLLMVGTLYFTVLSNPLDHMCGLGYKAFERYAGIGFGVVLACVVLFIRRLRIGFPVAISLFFAWMILVVRPYLRWVHDPQNPTFAELRAHIEPPDFME
jgi:ABC-type Fe3+-siderophore transport system permease subunit